MKGRKKLIAKVPICLLTVKLTGKSVRSALVELGLELAFPPLLALLASADHPADIVGRVGGSESAGDFSFLDVFISKFPCLVDALPLLRMGLDEARYDFQGIDGCGFDFSAPTRSSGTGFSSNGSLPPNTVVETSGGESPLVFTPLARRFPSPDLESEKDDLSWLTKDAQSMGNKLCSLRCWSGDLLSTIFEEEVERLRHFCEIPHNITFRTPEKSEGPLKGKEGHIVMWFEAYKELPSMDALRGLFGLCCTWTSDQFYTYIDNLIYCDIPCKGFSRKWLFIGGDWEGVPAAGSVCRLPRGLVNIICPTLLTVGEWMVTLKAKTVVPTTQLATKARFVNTGLWKLGQVFERHPLVAEGVSSDPVVDPLVVDVIKNISASRGSAPKSQRMVGSSSKSTTPLRLTSSTGVGASQTPTNRVTRSQADHELPKRFQVEKNQAPPPRPTYEGLSALISATNSALNSQFRAQVDNDNIDKTFTGTVNVSLQAAYQTMVTAQQLKNMKDEQTSSKKPLQVLEGKYKILEQSLNSEKNEKAAVVNRMKVAKRGLSSSKMRPSTGNQGAYEAVEKVMEAAEVEKVAEDEEKN
ncbi:hypothetical protein FNV43_RR13059 [Rhamnella rubrinervis]|uniref:Uncharacterized protein n=1 Tax=Rhamnella rubrinervis TaxID=2594499 RepID=A0A8K0MEM9_9ROSA|nr:hypothetical protein FNV43_RR13059 [Rhamnella rubrinervis]